MKEKPLPKDDTEHEFTEDGGGDLLSGVAGVIAVADVTDVPSGGLRLYKRYVPDTNVIAVSGDS